MTPFAISGLLAGISSLLFGSLVILRSTDKRIGRAWFLFTLSTGAWGFGVMLTTFCHDATTALWVWRFVYAFGANWIAPLFFHFVLTFTETPQRRALYWQYAIASVFFVLAFTPMQYEGVKWFRDSYYSSAGYLYWLSSLWWLGLVTSCHIHLLKVYSRMTPLKKAQIKYFFIAMAFGFSGGSFCFLPPLGIDFYPWGNFSICLYPIVMSYAIVKYRLMNLELLARDTVVSALTWLSVAMPFLIGSSASVASRQWSLRDPSVGLGVGIFALLSISSLSLLSMGGIKGMGKSRSKLAHNMSIWCLSVIAGILLERSLGWRVVGILIMAGLAPRLIEKMRPVVQAVVDRRLFNEKFSYLKEIERIGDNLFRWTNLPELLKHLVHDLAARARLSWVGVWLFDVTAGAYHLHQASGFEKNEDLPSRIWSAAFGPASALVRRLERDRQLVVADEELARQKSGDGGHPSIDIEATSELGAWNIAAALPMYSGEKLVGFIGFGPKLRQEAFHDADIAGLSDLGKKAQWAIAQAYMLYQQAKMLAKLAHDILNFINPQTLAVQELASKFGPLAPEQKKHLKTIWNQKDLIEESIRDLLELERLVELRMEGKWRMKPYQITDLVRNSASAYQAKADGKGVTVELALGECPDGIGDYRSIRRVIDNLLINALKFTPRGGRIRVAAERAGVNLRLTVSDSGAGIPPGDLPRIFDPFYQGSNHPGLTQGTGIGLSNVKEFVNLHKGSLRVESELGAGTTFIIDLPSVERIHEFDASMIDVGTVSQAAA